MAEEDGRTRPTVAEPLPRPSRSKQATASLAATAGSKRLAEGTQLGRFRIVELLGEGGMGAVYRASDAELGRHVAIKVLSGEGESLAGGAVEQRLMREAQALAKLNHPNVIAIYDVARDHGVAFVAMELVEGLSLDKWLKEGTRSRRQIVEAFAQAGRGLAAAHKEGLVHRDFKLANVIVGADGRIRVLDFGLARASGSISPDAHVPTTEDEPASHDLRSSWSEPSSNLLSNPLTRVGALVGTPTYMAPEQLRAGDVDARSDQFSFCVALYRALYGEQPFGGNDVQDRLSNIQAGRVRAAPADRDVPPWLRRLLLRGLAADPNARFPTMDALLDALADDPAPRRRRMLIAGVSVLMLGVGGVAFVRFAGAPEAPQPCAGAAQALTNVWNPARRAEIAKTFVASDRPFAKKMLSSVTDALDRYGKAWTSMRFEACRATRVSGQQSGELLDLRMQCLDRHLDHLRATTDVLVAADATVIEKALQVAQALPPLSECADATALRAPTPLPSDPTKRGQIAALRADLARSDALFAAGKVDEGTKLVMRVHEQAPALAYGPLSAEVALAVGSAQYVNGDYKTSEQTLTDGAAIALTARRDDLVVRFWRDLVQNVGYQQRRFAEAHAWAGMAQAMLGRVQHDPHEKAKLYGAISALYLAEDKRDDALRYDELALDIAIKAFGEGSLAAADALSNVGVDYFYKRNFAKAREIHARTLAVREKLLGPDHPSTARSLLNIASATAELGDVDEATAQTKRALGIFERAFGLQHPLVATVLGNLGRNFAMSGRFDEAMAAYDRAMAIVKMVYGPKHTQVALLHARRGTLLRRQGRRLEGLAEYQAALAIDQANDPNSAATGRDHLDIAECLTGLDRLDEARREFERALAVLAKALGPNDMELADPYAGLGKIEHALGNTNAGVTALEKAVSLLPADDTSVASTSIRFELARALWDSGRERARARQLAEQAKRELEASQDEDREETLVDVTKWLSTRK